MGKEHEIVALVYAAKTDVDRADAFIRQYMGFIRAETARFLHRIPRAGEDDELSIAMMAFHEAIMGYDRGQGAFLKYAALCIRSRLTDYARREKRHRGHLSLDAPLDTEGDGTLLDTLDTGGDNVAAHSLRLAAREEIREFGAQLAQFGVSFSDVADNCPRQQRTLAACAAALAYARREPALLQELLRTKKLPLAALVQGTGLERKTLERHRKYLLAILLAFTNGYEIIRGHLCQLAPKGGDDQ